MSRCGRCKGAGMTYFKGHPRAQCEVCNGSGIAGVPHPGRELQQAEARRGLAKLASIRDGEFLAESSEEVYEMSLQKITWRDGK